MTAGTEVVREDAVSQVEAENKSDCGVGVTNLNNVGGSADSDDGGGGNGKKDDSDYSSYVFVSKNVEVTGDDPAEMGGVNGHSGSADEAEQVKKEESGNENREITFDSLELEDTCIDHSDAEVKGFEVQALKEVGNLENGSAVDFSVVLETNGIAQDSVDSHLGEITGLVVTRTNEVEDVNEIPKAEPEMDDPKSRIKVGSESTPNTTDSSQVTDFESEATPKLIENSKSEVKTQSGSTSNVIVAGDEPHYAVNPAGNTDPEVKVEDVLESNGNLIEKKECQVTFDGLESTGKPTDKMDPGVTVDDGSESSGDPIETPGCQISVCGSESTENPTENQECQVSVDVLESKGNPIEKEEYQVTFDGLESTGKPIDKMDPGVTVDGSESSGDPIETPECQVSVCGSAPTEIPIENQECQVSVDVLDSTGKPIGNAEPSMEGAGSAGVSEGCKESSILMSKVDVEVEPNHVNGGLNVEHYRESESTCFSYENQKAGGTVSGLDIESEESPGSVIMMSESADVPTNTKEEELDLIVELGKTKMSQSEANERELSEVGVENVESREQVEKQVEESSESLVKGAQFEILEEAKLVETKKEQVEIVYENKESQIVVSHNVQNDSNPEVGLTESGGKAGAPLESKTTSKQINEVANSQNENASCRCLDEAEIAIQLKGSVINEESLPSTDFDKSECKTADKEKDILSNPNDVSLIGQQVECGAPDMADTSSAEATDCGTDIENLDVPDDERTQTEVKDAPVGGHSTLSLESKTTNKQINEVTNSQNENASSRCFDEAGTAIQLKGSVENEEILFSHPGDMRLIEQQLGCGAPPVADTGSAKATDCGTEAENLDVPDDERTQTEVKDAPVGGHSTLSLESKTTSKQISEVANSQNENASSRCFDEAETAIQLKASVENEEILLSNPGDMRLIEQQVESGAPPVADTSSAKATDSGTGTENLDVPDDEKTQTEVIDAPVGGHSTLPLESKTTSKQINELANSQKEKASGRCFDEAEPAIQLKGSVENEEILPSTDFVKSECKTADKEKNVLSNPSDMPLIEQQVECGAPPMADTSSAEATDSGTEVENLDVPAAERTQSEVKHAPVGGHSTLTSPDEYSSPGTAIQFGSIGRHGKTPSMHHDYVNTVANVVYGANDPACGADGDKREPNHNGSEGEKNDDKVTCQEDEDMDGIRNDMIPISSVEDCRSDVIYEQNEEAEVLPYNFLIRIPRFEDEMLREQIKQAQLQVDVKTELRDAIRAEIYGIRATLKAHNEDFNAAKSEATAARRLVRLKRQDIDSVQCVINRVKNALSVEDIDHRIHNMEHMMQHETLRLNEEKQYIREMKQLKNLRDQLASNMGSQEEVQQALAQKDQIEERLKILKKELDSLKDKVSKAEAAAIAVGKLFDEERKKEKELQSQFRAADDVRQGAYAHLNSLKKQFYDKNKNFRTYKKDMMAARDFASRGEKNALHRLCANQVETFMELWNTNDEFRKEYINSSNMNASRRGRTLLGPDEVPPMLPNHVDRRVDRSLISEVKSMSMVSTVEQVKKDSSFEEGHTVDKVSAKLPGKKNQVVKTIELATPTLGSDPAEKDEDAGDINEEEKMLTKEELELAMKAEELMKEESAAKLKEQRRLEEKAKEMEALERKKRHAEKAQKRAELRAQKEAEQKEKERERRLRKKEKKKAGGEGSGEDAAAANTENAKEAAVKENHNSITNKKTQKPPPHFFSKALKPKPIPPPLAIRQKKRWQHWAKLLITALVVIALFVLGNTGFFLNLKHLKSNPTF